MPKSPLKDQYIDPYLSPLQQPSLTLAINPPESPDELLLEPSVPEANKESALSADACELSDKQEHSENESSVSNLIEQTTKESTEASTTVPGGKKRGSKPRSMSTLEEGLTRVFRQVTLPAPTFANMNCCENCGIDVGVLLVANRHHCRNCGGTFCDDCSSLRSYVPYEEYVNKGLQRVCDGCFVKIEDFHSQTKKQKSITWGGLNPLTDEEFWEEFNLDPTEIPVVIYACCFFPQHHPFYGHLYLTQNSMFFRGYGGKRVVLKLEDIDSVVKPDLLFLNAIQVYRRTEKFFFAGFNGQSDDCYRRFDQLLTVSRVKEKLDVAEGKESPSSGKMRRQISLRRASKMVLDESTRMSLENVPEDSLSGDSDTEEAVESDLPPPDSVVAKMTSMLDEDLEITVRRAFDLFWSDESGVEFYDNYMKAQEDIDVEIGQWQRITPENKAELSRGFVSSTEDFEFYRHVSAKHPPKVSFPGLPKYAFFRRLQRYRTEGIGMGDRLVISDMQRMEKIPFSDVFEIENRWVFTRDGPSLCHVEMGLTVNFVKSTWFKGQIVSSTNSECRDACKLWYEQAIKQIAQYKIQSSSPAPSPNKPTQKKPQIPFPIPARASVPLPAPIPENLSSTKYSSFESLDTTSRIPSYRYLPVLIAALVCCMCYQTFLISSLHSTTESLTMEVIELTAQLRHVQNAVGTCAIDAENLYTRDETKPCCQGSATKTGAGEGQVIDLADGFRLYVNGTSNKQAIILSYDIFGFDVDETRLFCDKLAKVGFFVVMPDYFRGDSWPLDQEISLKEGSTFMKWVLSFTPEKIAQDVNRTLEYLGQSNVDKIGMIGFCWGGLATILSSALPAISACALLHGSFLVAEHGEKVECPVLMIDSGTDPDRSDLIEIFKAKPHGHDFEYARYDDMVHGWTIRGNRDDPRQNQAMEEAYAKAEKFLLKHLKA